MIRLVIRRSPARAALPLGDAIGGKLRIEFRNTQDQWLAGVLTFLFILAVMSLGAFIAGSTPAAAPVGSAARRCSVEVSNEMATITVRLEEAGACDALALGAEARADVEEIEQMGRAVPAEGKR